MFVREHQNQYRNAQADVQRYYGASGATSEYSWNKPVGTTFVYIMLIGGGGAGNLTDTGGGTGSIAVWFGPARHIPPSLQIEIAPTATSIISAAQNTTIFQTAGALQNIAGSATTANGYWLSGFYTFTAGVNGTTGAPSAGSSTFLMAGGATATSVTGQYGYVRPTNGDGYFLLSPIPVGLSSATGSSSSIYGCGNYFGSSIKPPGMALIASW